MKYSLQKLNHLSTRFELHLLFCNLSSLFIHGNVWEINGKLFKALAFPDIFRF